MLKYRINMLENEFRDFKGHVQKQGESFMDE